MQGPPLLPLPLVVVVLSFSISLSRRWYISESLNSPLWYNVTSHTPSMLCRLTMFVLMSFNIFVKFRCLKNINVIVSIVLIYSSYLFLKEHRILSSPGESNTNIQSQWIRTELDCVKWLRCFNFLQVIFQEAEKVLKDKLRPLLLSVTIYLVFYVFFPL